jgi:hypothetical protein
VVEISNILAKEELWPLVVSPVLIFKNVMLLFWDEELTSTTELFLELLDRGTCLFHFINNCLRDVGVSDFVISLLWLSNMQLFHDGLGFLWVLGL